ncbi:ImmA/IrrE family metallo-endopeptidase [Rhizobium sp. LjRoot30]|uniref:ImmA/IrrE family metallo-endopeptidase n=1 Tax=Rhizobium sp. LjRoot30 TaxID=3342320 RepID=UPI003ED14059
MVEYLDPIPTGTSKASVHNFAEELARNLSFEPGDAFDRLISMLSGKVLYRNPSTQERPEAIRVEPSGRFEIYLPSVTSLGRDRFTIAHELGHFFLHFPMVQELRGAEFGMQATRWVDEGKPELRRCEWEANWFAAAFMMPEEEFREAFAQHESLARVASLFGVTIAAATVRAQSLNIPVMG